MIIKRIKELNGVFEYALSIHGNYDKIIRDGEITIKNAHLDILQLDNRINNINSYAVINNNRLIINNFSAELYPDNNSSTLISELKSSVKNIISLLHLIQKLSIKLNVNGFLI